MGSSHPGLPGGGLGHPEVGLVDLGQPGVDDLLVERLLLLEAEDLARLLAEHVHDPVEDGVVEVGVVDRDRLHPALEPAAQLDGGAQAGEALGRAVDGHHDVALTLPVQVADQEDVGAEAAEDSLGHRPEARLADRAGAEGAHHHQVRLHLGDVGDDLLPVAPVPAPGLELHPPLQAAIPHHVGVAVADQLQPGGDQGVVDPALPEQLGLVLVLLGEGVLHLLEPEVVHPRRVGVHPDAAGPPGRRQLDRQPRRRVRMLGVVQRDIQVGVAVDGGHLVLDPCPRRRARPLYPPLRGSSNCRNISHMGAFLMGRRT